MSNKDNLPIDPEKIPRIIRPLSSTTVRALNDRVIHTSVEVGEKRLEICKECPSFSDWACLLSNQFMPKLVRVKSAICPRGFWSSHWDD